MQEEERAAAQDPRCQTEHRGSFFVGNIRQSVTIRFGESLREQRRRLGLTQAELAARTGLARSSISEIERGREHISLERAERLAQAVHSTLADLLGKSGGGD